MPQLCADQMHDHEQYCLTCIGAPTEGILHCTSVSGLADTLDEAAVWDLLKAQHVCIGEHQLLHLVKTWCNHNKPETFQQMVMYMDFGLLTHEQVHCQAARVHILHP